MRTARGHLFRLKKILRNAGKTMRLFWINNGDTTMKFATIALAAAFALTSTFALANTTRHKAGVRTHHGTVGMSSARMHRGSMNSGNPNGTAGGRTSLSGTGSSQFGGSSPGTTGKN